MAEHRYIKIPKINSIFNSKAQAIEKIVRYIENHLDDFHDGESLLVRFRGDKGDIVSANVFVNVNEESEVTLSFGLDSSETIRVVESEEEPQDKETLWLTDHINEEDITVTNLQRKIDSLESAIHVLQRMVIAHEKSLTTDLGGGDLIQNSFKYEESNKYEQEAPEDIQIINTETEDTDIVNFELYYGNTNLDYYTSEGSIYKGQNYFIEPRYYNAEEERVTDSGVTIDIVSSNIQVANVYQAHSGKWLIYAETSGISKFTATVTKPDGSLLPSKEYTLNFQYNEEPTRDYPNVKHLLVKTVDTFDILSGNTDQMLLNELVWCIGNSSLYIKAYNPKKTSINLYKINGSGDTPTPPVIITGITFEYDAETGILDIEDTGEIKQVYVDEEGILHLNGEVDEYGILHLHDSGTPPVPVTTGITFEVNDETGVLEITDKNEVQQIYVNEDSVLHLIGYVDDEGILYLNDSGEETHIVDENGNLILDNIIVDEDGYLIFANASVDENGNLIMN